MIKFYAIAWFDYTIIFNFSNRWITRSAYGIGGTNECLNDGLLSTFCPCRVTNQLFQTTKDYRNPSTDGGAIFNVNQIRSIPSRNECTNCLCSCCCIPCSVGKMMNDAVGTPYYLGCHCTPLFLARNLIRYQFRISPKQNGDCMTECLILYVIYCLAGLAFTILPPLWICVCLAIWGALISVVMQSRSGTE